MIRIEKGRYWDLPWSLVSGCTPCSPGCDHCWAAAMEHRTGARIIKGVSVSIAYGTACGYEDHIPSPLTDGQRQFNGHIVTHHERLNIPLKRRKPTVFAVWNDLFHEAVPSLFPHHANIRMAQCPQHTFLLLTKRPHVLRKRKMSPIDNVWIGLTVCNQSEADEKIPVFLQIPGKKFLSIEPMLSEINIEMALEEFQPLNPDLSRKPSPINAVILGGETGPGARLMHPDWVRSVRDQCAPAQVPFFFKGWGAWKSADFVGDKMVPGSTRTGRLLDGLTHDDLPWVKENK